MAAPAVAPPPESIASVTPLVANFPPPYDKAVSAYLRIANLAPGQETLAFKVKTTAPKRYLVHPNLGTVAAGDTASIQLILHPPEPSLPDAELAAQAHKDRFQVHVTPIDPTRCRSVDDLRDMFAHLDEDRAVKFTVKCRFKALKAKPAPDTAAAGAGAGAAAASPARVAPAEPARTDVPRANTGSSVSRELALALPPTAAVAVVPTAVPAPPAPAAAGTTTTAAGTSQDKYEATLAHMERVRETQLLDPANVGLVLDERRRLKQKVEELQTRLREVLADRDRLALQLRSSPARTTATPAGSDLRSHLLLYVLLVVVAYLFGKWY